MQAQRVLHPIQIANGMDVDRKQEKCDCGPQLKLFHNFSSFEQSTIVPCIKN